MASLMYDSDNETYPDGCRYIAAYVDGPRTGQNFALAKKERPDAKFLLISAVGEADADVIDIEQGNVWPPEAAIPWLKRQLAQGKTPIYYCNSSTRQQCINAFMLAGLPVLPWWRADYRQQYADNPPNSLPMGEIAWQYANPPLTGAHWDVSLISDQVQAHLEGVPDALNAAEHTVTQISTGIGPDIGGALAPQPEEDDLTPEEHAWLESIVKLDPGTGIGQGIDMVLERTGKIQPIADLDSGTAIGLALNMLLERSGNAGTDPVAIAAALVKLIGPELAAQVAPHLTITAAS